MPHIRVITPKLFFFKISISKFSFPRQNILYQDGDVGVATDVRLRPLPKPMFHPALLARMTIHASRLRSPRHHDRAAGARTALSTTPNEHSVPSARVHLLTKAPCRPRPRAAIGPIPVTLLGPLPLCPSPLSSSSSCESSLYLFPPLLPSLSFSPLPSAPHAQNPLLVPQPSRRHTMRRPRRIARVQFRLVPPLPSSPAPPWSHSSLSPHLRALPPSLGIPLLFLPG